MSRPRVLPSNDDRRTARTAHKVAGVSPMCRLARGLSCSSHAHVHPRPRPRGGSSARSFTPPGEATTALCAVSPRWLHAPPATTTSTGRSTPTAPRRAQSAPALSRRAHPRQRSAPGGDPMTRARCVLAAALGLLVIVPGAGRRRVSTSRQSRDNSFTGNVVDGRVLPAERARRSPGATARPRSGTSDGSTGIQGTHTYAEEGTYTGSVSYTYASVTRFCADRHANRPVPSHSPRRGPDRRRTEPHRNRRPFSDCSSHAHH